MRCCRSDGRYAPGEVFECTWHLERVDPDHIQGLEVSVLWYTEGKGDEDISVHYFRRLSAARLRTMDLSEPQKFATVLPASPLTYNGHLLRIRWCARMRLFLAGGQEILTEQPFTMLAAVDA